MREAYGVRKRIYACRDRDQPIDPDRDTRARR
jgi:hypothetical protein